MGLLKVLPLSSDETLRELGNIHQLSRSITELYGSIPKSKEAGLQRLHDNSLLESLKMVSHVQRYARRQESNARILSLQSRRASPKGASRMNVETNAKILHTLNQLLKVNVQILKLQGEQLAMTNKESKDSTRHFQKINADIKKSFKGFSGTFELPKF